MKCTTNIIVEHMTASEGRGFHNYGICGASSIDIACKNYHDVGGVELEVENPSVSDKILWWLYYHPSS